MARSSLYQNPKKRDQWVKNALAQLTTDVKILDVGAGQMKYRSACQHVQYTSQDFCQYDGVGDATGLQKNTWNHTGIDIVSDICDIPMPDASFDVVLCTEVLEHVPDPVGAIREIGRLLIPGGVLLLTAPFNSLSHFSPYHFHTGFSRHFYEYWLPRCGFSISELKMNGNYFSYVAQELARVPIIHAKYDDGTAHWTPWTLLMRLCRHLCLQELRRLAENLSESQELGCFGLLVRAEKASE